MSISRYTTPDLTLTIPNTTEPDLTEADNVYVTFADGTGEIFTKTGDALIVDEYAVDVYLSQEETASFRSGIITVTMNWTYHEGNRVKRAKAGPAKIEIKDNALKRVVE